MKVPADNHNWQITSENLIQSSIYYAVRHCIAADWLNDRDQFLYPNEGWIKDDEFQNDCLTYTLFNNGIQSKFGINHWIPFTESEVNAREKFQSNFMNQFIHGKSQHTTKDLFTLKEHGAATMEFSIEAKNVFNAGRELWTYYHAQPACNINASLYDIREFFQSRDSTGKMNLKSDDITYMELISELRKQWRILERKLVPKLYEYGFLKS